ncbi:metalloregulator ArsR/SmtB family transcription factor [bacterium]|nr:metalloregulator ArsR/SmtB family transcription factor [bacterium]
MKFKSAASEDLEKMAHRVKALADSSRLRILQTLYAGEKPVNSVVNETGLEQANTSKHLAFLTHTGFAKSRRSGTTIYYSLSSPAVKKMLKKLLKGFEKID